MMPARLDDGITDRTDALLEQLRKASGITQWDTTRDDRWEAQPRAWPASSAGSRCTGRSPKARKVRSVQTRATRWFCGRLRPFPVPARKPFRSVRAGCGGGGGI